MLEEKDIQQIKDIIHDEIEGLFKLDRYSFTKHIQISDGRNIQTGRTTGTKIGTASDQLVSFFGQTPVDQPETIADPSGGATVDQPARDGVIALIARLKELGLIK